MAQFNLDSYETVEQRIARFYGDHPDGRIITENLTTIQDRQVSTWVVKAEIWLPIWDAGASFVTLDDYKNGYKPETAWFLKSTGLAFEIDGAGMTQKTSALETCETSAIGRALANAGYSGSKRVTREEMEKVERGVTPKAPGRNWAVEAKALADTKDIDGLRTLYSLAVSLKVSAPVLEEIKAYANGLTGS